MSYIMPCVVNRRNISSNLTFGKQAEKERKSFENQKRSKKEDRYEAKKDKKFKKALTPFLRAICQSRKA